MSISRIVVVFAAVAAFLPALPACSALGDKSGASQTLDDGGITAAIKARLAADKTTDAGSVSVETINGTVMLSGYARTAAQKTSAEAAARSIKGVTSVDNRIAVRP